MPPGSMLAVKLPEEELKAHLSGDMTIGVINTASLCAVSGETSEIDELERSLGEKGHHLPQASYFARVPFGDDGANAR